MDISRIMNTTLKKLGALAVKAIQKRIENLPITIIAIGTFYALSKLFLENRELKLKIDNKFKEGYDQGTNDAKENYKDKLDSFTTRDFYYLVACKAIAYIVEIEENATKEQLKKFENYSNLFIKTPSLSPKLKTRLEEICNNKIDFSKKEIFTDMDRLLERCKEEDKSELKKLLNGIISDLITPESCKEVSIFYSEWCNKYK